MLMDSDVLVVNVYQPPPLPSSPQSMMVLHVFLQLLCMTILMPHFLTAGLATSEIASDDHQGQLT